MLRKYRQFIYLAVFWLMLGCAEKIDTNTMKPVVLSINSSDDNILVDKFVKQQQEILDKLQQIRWQQNYQDVRTLSHGNEAIVQVALNQIKEINIHNQIIVLDDQHFLVVNGTNNTLDLYMQHQQSPKSVVQKNSFHPQGGIVDIRAQAVYRDGLLVLTAVGNDQVVAYTLDLTAKKDHFHELWRIKVGDLLATQAVLTSDSVYVYGQSNKLYKLDRHSGQVQWLTFTGENNTVTAARVPPILYKQAIITFSSLGQVTAFNQKDGKILWHLNTGMSIRLNSPQYILHNPVFVLREDSILYFNMANSGLFAVDLNTGRFLWQSDLTADDVLLSYQGSICFMSSKRELICVNKASGQVEHRALITSH